MEQVNPSYYANIPANVRYDKELTPNAKLLYGEITALCNKEGYCWAGNSYFAKLYDVKKETISRWIANLNKKGYIKTEIVYKLESKEIDKRKIYIAEAYKQNNQHPIDEIINTPIDEKVKGNTTSNNTTFNKESVEIINYLNAVSGKKFKTSTKTTKEKIRARINEGFSVEDFKQVIDVKTNEWLNDEKMDKYIRPKTLFGTSFESYLNQKTTTEKEWVF